MSQSDQPIGQPTGCPASEPRVLERTPQWLALAKPAGWLTIPGRTAEGATAAPVLSEWVERELGVKPWVVHRLDRETSGVLLFALDAEAHRQANQWFSGHNVRKTYDLLAAGSMTAPVARANQPVDGAHSVTQIEVRERFEACFLARALPLTGRRHQIRVHLSLRGNPLLGDPTYGGPGEVALGGAAGLLAIPRVALHAARLELPSGDVFEAPWPADFDDWVERLRGAIGVKP
jgi:23S rRNA-/tRNA-specific pseudouridylate synthase